ncbi:hypothetical protein, partial [Parvibium lacunae]
MPNRNQHSKHSRQPLRLAVLLWLFVSHLLVQTDALAAHAHLACTGPSITASINTYIPPTTHPSESLSTPVALLAQRPVVMALVAVPHTQLTGAAITSQAAAEHNQLSTGSLASVDLTNRQQTQSQSNSLSLSYNGAAGGMANLTSNLS